MYYDNKTISFLRGYLLGLNKMKLCEVFENVVFSISNLEYISLGNLSI